METIFLARQRLSKALKFFSVRPQALKSNPSIHFCAERPKGLFGFKTDGSVLVKGWALDLDTSSQAGVRIKIGRTAYFPQIERRADVQKLYPSIPGLPNEVGFIANISVPPGLHRIKVQIAGERKWIPIKKGWVLHLPLTTGFKGISRFPERGSYRDWVRFERAKLAEELDEIRQHIQVMLYKPHFTIVVDVRNGCEGFERTLNSIRQQVYQHCDIRILGDLEAKSERNDDHAGHWQHITHPVDAFGDFVLLLTCGKLLSVNALYEFASALNTSADVDIIYGDEDSIDKAGRRTNPFYKPDWSPDYIETFNYVGVPVCFRRSIAPDDFGLNPYDAILRLTERTSKIKHLPKILAHNAGLPQSEDQQKRAAQADIRALEGRLARTGRSGTVREHQQHKGCYDVRLTLKASPVVSVIIPTAGKVLRLGDRQIDLIQNVVDQILNRSTYKNIEIIIVDNGDLPPLCRDNLIAAGCKMVSYQEKEFNISKKLNLGVELSRGELLLLMNDDIEVVSPCWIERLVEHFEKSHVGVVGAKLLYPDGRIQHAGVTHDFGVPDHVNRLQHGNDAGYFFSTCGVRNFSAVTGAVMMVRKNIYIRVGGYSEELAVSYNDIDFCLKVQGEGLSVVYAPEATLIHMEAVSRIPGLDWRAQQWYRERWSAKIVPDPFYNERFLSVSPATFKVGINRRRF